MQRLSQADLENALVFVGDLAGDDSFDPLPHVFRGLERLFPGTAIEWVEIEVAAFGCRALDVRRSRERWWDLERWQAHQHLDPILRKFGCHFARPVMYSDCLSTFERRTDVFWNEVIRPAGIRDQLSVSLTASGRRRWQIELDRFDREFSERDRAMLTVLRPHFGRLCATAHVRRTALEAKANGTELTARQVEVLRWVALGRTNAEIAELLSLSAGTVRKHMDNVFATLGVHSRAAAVALVFGTHATGWA
jgi:DNA-binding CsgD family transcriptional regulator